jgi:hypothetical protein
MLRTMKCVECGHMEMATGSKIYRGWCWWCIKNKMEGHATNAAGQFWNNQTDDTTEIWESHPFTVSPSEQGRLIIRRKGAATDWKGFFIRLQITDSKGVTRDAPEVGFDGLTLAQAASVSIADKMRGV